MTNLNKTKPKKKKNLYQNTEMNNLKHTEPDNKLEILAIFLQAFA